MYFEVLREANFDLYFITFVLQIVLSMPCLSLCLFQDHKDDHLTLL